MSLVFAACGHGDLPARDEDKSPVVAEVDGVAIHVAALEARVRHDRVAPRVALQRLIDETLTARAAEKLGLHANLDLAFTRERAAVQALLAREVEAPIRPEDLSEEDLARGWESGWTLQADHLLAKFGTKATAEIRAQARALAARVGAAAKTVTSREDFIALARTMREPGVELVHEDLGTFTRDGRFVRAFEERVFRMKRADEVSAPFETEFGWHVVRLRSVTNVFGESPEAAREEVATKLVLVRRREALEAFVRRLEKKAHVVIDESAFEPLDRRP